MRGTSSGRPRRPRCSSLDLCNEECTYLVGEMHWAAMFVTLFVKRIAPALSGVGLLVWGLVDQTWQLVAFGAVLTLTLGWMSIDMLRTTGQDQRVRVGWSGSAGSDDLAEDR